MNTTKRWYDVLALKRRIECLLSQKGKSPAALTAATQWAQTQFVLEQCGARFDEIERKLAEKSFEVPYEGVYEDGREYKRGAFCTHGGSMWYAKSATRAAPGTDGAWVLAVKRGKEGKPGARAA